VQQGADGGAHAQPDLFHADAGYGQGMENVRLAAFAAHAFVGIGAISNACRISLRSPGLMRAFKATQQGTVFTQDQLFFLLGVQVVLRGQRYGFHVTMQIDKITFNDISIFHAEEEFSIFHKLNFTRTQGGKEWLRRFFNDPHGDLKKIVGTQNIIKTIIDHLDEWPAEITNGTIIMVDKVPRLQPGPGAAGPEHVQRPFLPAAA
jgi:hypothetical protein